MNEKHLYIALLGGRHEKAHVEVHDVVPFVGTDLVSAYPYLKSRWFGAPKGLHVDSWMKINGVVHQGKNYRVSLSDLPDAPDALKLFLINLGAYVPGQFGEVHKYLVVAGKDKAEAKQQGKLAMEEHWFKPHTDAVIDVDDCLALDLITEHHIHLTEGDFEANAFQNDYLIID